MTAQYWAWKNLDADYYGFFHYRRYLSFADQRFSTDQWQNVVENTPTRDVLDKYKLTDDHIQGFVENYDIVLSEEKNVAKMPDRNKSIYEQYKNGRSLNIKDLDLVRKLLQRNIRIILILLTRL